MSGALPGPVGPQGTTITPHGRVITLRHSRYAASVATGGAALATLSCAGHDLVLPLDALPPEQAVRAFVGKILLPWPNRVGGGRYTWDGVEQQLAITEPLLDNAIHGLVCWADWSIVESDAASAVFETTVLAQPGYPHALAARAAYRLDDSGLTITVTATNVGDTDAPYGVAVHPYLVSGDASRPGAADAWTVGLAAPRVIEADERLLPVGERDVAAAGLDLRAGRQVGEATIDHAFAGLPVRWAAVVSAPDAPFATVLHADTPWAQVYVGDGVARRAVAIEPMSCPPDAFRSGIGVHRLTPGASHTLSLRIAAEER
ncbi:MAG TPA: aldose-1-epimerase [Dermatophilaceae bacterium]|nr:aldose-1-epimerase [Dermatophilaceae bacterium]